MEIKYLLEFSVLAKTGNYLEAADALYIAQSSLSKHIQSLERELNTTLFDRSTRHVRLTEDGKLLLHYAEDVTQIMNEYYRASAALSHKKRNVISIASTSQMVYYGITDALAHYKRQNLSCILDVTIDSHSNLKRLLYNHKVDFIWIGETTEESKDDKFTRMLYLEDELAAVLPPNHPWENCDAIPLQALKDETLIIQDNSSIEQQIFIETCLRCGFTPKLTSLPISTVIDFVKRNLGIAIMLKSVAERSDFSNVHMISLEPSPPPVNVNLICMKESRLTSAAKQFWNFFKNWQPET